MDRRFILIFAAVFLTISSVTFADRIILKEKAEGNEVEIIEEKPDAFIVKIPKQEIEKLVRNAPTEIELWKEKKILWEDMGDYIAIHLPKERIIKKGEKEGEFHYETVESFQEGLKVVGGDKVSSVYKSKGGIRGRILKRGRPFEGCSVKLRYVRNSASLLPHIDFDADKKEEIIFEAVTDKDGYYEFNDLTPGNYDIFWKLSGGSNWIRRLSEKPDITVLPGETTVYKDIEVKIR